MTIQPDLRRQAVRSAWWTGGAAILRAGLQAAQIMLLARLLSPADFGLMAIVAAIAAIVQLVAEGGIGVAIIQARDTTRAQLSGLYWLSLALGAAASLALAAGAWPIARLYGDPRLVDLVLTVSPVFLITAVGRQFRVLAEKELRFRALALIETVATLAGAGAAVGLAWSGAGVYALAGGFLAATACAALLYCAASRPEHRPHLAAGPADLARYLAFGARMTGSNLVNALTTQADILIGGRCLDPGALGLYQVPRDLALRPAQLINPVVTRIALPVNAAVQEDPGRLRAVFLSTMRATATLNVPLHLFALAFADPLVRVVLGEHWSGMGNVFALLAAWALLRSLNSPVGSVVLAVGRPGRALAWNVGVAVLAIPTLLLCAPHGAWALAGGLLALQALLFVPSWAILVRPFCAVTLRDHLAAIARPLAAAVLACLLARLAVLPLDALLAILGTGLGVAVAVYVACIAWWDPALVRLVLARRP